MLSALRNRHNRYGSKEAAHKFQHVKPCMYIFSPIFVRTRNNTIIYLCMFLPQSLSLSIYSKCRLDLALTTLRLWVLAQLSLFATSQCVFELGLQSRGGHTVGVALQKLLALMAEPSSGQQTPQPPSQHCLNDSPRPRWVKRSDSWCWRLIKSYWNRNGGHKNKLVACRFSVKK